ncbi:uncharacterized protein N7525_001985 [Penicillium rubens]|uniref:uncharacterized protein n=1 Tax=Penicillium rubens TaxID=1108849 RepID=UPI002A59B836|nr:uncharacterized protein N7525_001985 [Penicillium rubens]KAJ5844244.1 hypothetical protein N7525_001985 [Penicillium rubens]
MESVSPYAVSATNRSGLIVIVETLFMTWMIMVSLIRLYMRLAINGPVKIDDVVVFAGSVMAIAHVGTIMDAISHGLGRSEDESSRSNLTRAECLRSEPSISGWTRRSQDFHIFTSQTTRPILLGMVTAWMLASILTVALSCFPRYQFTMAQHCSSTGVAWKMVTVFDVTTEILTFALCILLVWGVQMRWKQKWVVVFAFGTRAPVVILIILRQNYLTQSLFHPDAPLHLSDTIIVTAYYGIYSAMPKTVCYFTNGKGQNSYSTNSASTNQSHVYSTNRGGRDEADLTISRQSQDSQHSRRLIIHQTREWWVEEEEYEMHSIQDSI